MTLSYISVLTFPPAPATTDPNSTPQRDGLSSEETLTATHEWAFHVESRKSRFVNLRRPYSVVFTRTNTKTPIPYHTAIATDPPVLKLLIATARSSHHLLPQITTALSTVAADLPPEAWLDASLTALQKTGVVQRFSVDRFHDFAMDKLATMMPSGNVARRMSSGVTELDYLSLMSSKAEVKRMLAEGDGQGQQRAAVGGVGTAVVSG